MHLWEATHRRQIAGSGIAVWLDGNITDGRAPSVKWGSREVAEFAIVSTPKSGGKRTQSSTETQRVKSRPLTEEEVVASLGDFLGMKPMVADQIEDAASTGDAKNASSIAVANAARMTFVHAKPNPVGLSGNSDVDVPSTILPVEVQHQATHFAPVKGELMLPWQTDAFNAADLGAPTAPTVERSQLGQEATRHDGRRQVEPHAAITTAQNELSEASSDSAAAPPIGRQTFAFISNDASATPADLSNGGPAPATSRLCSAPALRTLSLQLSPATLGPVTLELSNSSSGLRIQLAAHRGDTAGMVEQGRDEIIGRLTGAGYAIDELLIGKVSTPLLSNTEFDRPRELSSNIQSNMPDGGALKGGADQQSSQRQNWRGDGAEMPESGPGDGAPDQPRAACSATQWPRIAGSRFLRSI